ncbi:SCO-spondin-like, partial [Haliotis cracherodii]|uniref:SCO-spondin-like n=1 Tax=Haliotis cracherodii TaxID=6455 RepID=UPI0039E98F17
TGPSEESANRSCNHTECPIDGGFSEWGEWSNPDCPVTCGREAEKIVSRNRNCTEPPPQFGGANCTGPSEESANRSCNHTECPIDGGFSEWGEWSNPDCPVTCGREAEKIVSRNRNCTEPPPQFGGANCTGPFEESANRSCNHTECPIDGGFSEWGEWSNPDCPVTCGREAEKIVSRNRNCTEPPPQFGGANCTGPFEESANRSCNHTECPIDGGFSEWGEWSNPDCPVTCGREAEKIVSRNRNCTEPPPQFGGANCTGPFEESANRSCNHTECPIDGGFSEWGEWSNPDCPVTCGREAEKIVSRNRNCTEPPPQFGGTNCTGPFEESANRSCNHTECPIDGGFSEWGEWSNPDCPVTCGREAEKIVSRNRNCTEPPPQFGGANCTGPFEESANRSCNHTECPIDGGFSEWGEWSNPDCPVTCGREAEKIVSRNRNCTEPPPQFGGANCTGPFEESANRSCNHTECPIDGGFSEWGEWSNPDCPVTCGREAEKIVSRNRNCTEPPPQFGGANCTGPFEESANRSCNHTECPIDGGFSEWGEWSNPDCPVTCGREAEKIVSRNRNCTEPTPQFGGANCAGPFEESANRSCNHTECPIDGGFSEWGEWSNPDCPVTCGREAEKIVSRNRNCTEPPPQFGGANCAGPSEESANRSCNHTECPIDGRFTMWSEWNNPECSVSCSNNATKVVVRIRNCIPPEFGGAMCEGPYNESETRNCLLNQCPIDGGVSEWDDWSKPLCGERCGTDIQGFVIRTRTCTNPPPTYNGLFCTEHLQETATSPCNLPRCSSNDNVTDWTNWSEPVCTVTCGKRINGTASRTRNCTSPSNGINCVARLLERDTRECNLPDCPVDGGLSNWTSWSIVPCPLTCGVDAMTNQSRRRDCNNPAPEAGGKNCTGPLMETSQTHCNVPACSGDDNVTEWSQWSSVACTATCGEGQEGSVERSRSCVMPANNTSCTAALTETQMENCGLPKCPVNGGLSNWTYWSIVPCPVTCGVDAMTNQSRRRDCNNPAPEAGGKNCTGPLMETSQTHCNVPACSGDDNVTEWSQWSSVACTATCGEGQEGSVERSRSCVMPANNTSCTAALTETQMENCGLPKCPVNGGLSNWTYWSIVPCPVTCGVDAMTNQSRRRDCNNPAPEAGGKNCTGPLMETSQTHCNVPACSGDDNVTEWSQWSSVACTATCGEGQEGSVERSRSCVMPANNTSCTAALTETQMENCGLPKCPVNGGLSNWTSWSIVPCPVTCGVDAMTNQSRRRDCNNPAPEAGGKNCTGPLMETSQTHCNVPACSGDDNVTEWSQWSSVACTATCGEGQEGSVERSRSCVMPANNTSCTAALTETQMENCGLPKCPGKCVAMYKCNTFMYCSI